MHHLVSGLEAPVMHDMGRFSTSTAVECNQRRRKILLVGSLMERKWTVPHSGEKPVILVVDDDFDFRKGLCKSLTSAGFVVVECQDGAEAIGLFRGMDVDYLVTDLRMPKVDGIDLLEWVRRNRPHVRAVVVTAHGGESSRRFVLQQGALRFVEKPVDTEILVDLFRVANQMHGFVGSLQEADLVDYLETVCRAKRSLRLEVVLARGCTCALFVRKGSLVHAKCEEREGIEALETILEATYGTYAVYPWEDPPHRTIHEEAARILDGARRRPRARGSARP